MLLLVEIVVAAALSTVLGAMAWFLRSVASELRNMIEVVALIPRMDKDIDTLRKRTHHLENVASAHDARITVIEERGLINDARLVAVEKREDR